MVVIISSILDQRAMKVMHIFDIAITFIIQMSKWEYLRTTRLQIKLQLVFCSGVFFSFFVFRSFLKSLEKHLLCRSTLLFKAASTLIEERGYLYSLVDLFSKLFINTWIALHTLLRRIMAIHSTLPRIRVNNSH